jgi:hypothetical protein
VTIDCVPLTLPIANKMVGRLHRHHAPIPPGFPWFCIGAVHEGQLVGVAIAGRPTNRNNDDRTTVELLRVATDGTEHAPSALLGACARAAKAEGKVRWAKHFAPRPTYVFPEDEAVEELTLFGGAL